MQQLPATISKHWFGYVIIVGAGLLIAGLLGVASYSFYVNGLALELFAFTFFFAVVALLLTIVQIWVYSLSYVELTEAGIHVVNWRTLFVKTDVTTEWERVQDVSVATGSTWALLFNYGTLVIQTAGTSQELRMTMIPDAEYWQALIQANASVSSN